MTDTKQHKTIISILDAETQLRSKKELIERFIAEHFPDIPMGGDIGAEFDTYWDAERQKALLELSATEGLDHEGLQKLVGDYLFSDKAPLRDDIVDLMSDRPKLRELRKVSERIIAKVMSFVETFIDGVD